MAVMPNPPLTASAVLPDPPERDAAPTEVLLAFLELSALITSSLNLKTKLDAIAQATIRLLGTEKASIALRALASGDLEINPQMGHSGSTRRPNNGYANRMRCFRSRKG